MIAVKAQCSFIFPELLDWPPDSDFISLNLAVLERHVQPLAKSRFLISLLTLERKEDILALADRD